MFVAVAYAAEAAAQPAQGIGNMLFPMVVIFGIFYFLIIRPQQKKAKDHTKSLEALKSGDEVVTSGGIYGVITRVDGDSVIIEIADKVKVRAVKSQLYPRKKKAEEQKEEKKDKNEKENKKSS